MIEAVEVEVAVAEVGWIGSVVVVVVIVQSRMVLLSPH